MKKVLKGLGLVLIGFILLLIIVGGTVYVLSERSINHHYDVQPAAVTIPTDSAALAHGAYIAVTRGCQDCHGEDKSGLVFLEATPVGRYPARNLTAGAGGVGSTYSDADWVRAIRHGVDPSGRALLFMPSHEYYHLNDGDLGALIAHLKALPPVDNVLPAVEVGPVARLLQVMGEMPLISAAMIDHEAPRPAAPALGETPEYGAYVAVGCTGCHGHGFSGGPIPGVPPEWPPAANLTPDPATGLGQWTEPDFFTLIRTGVRPDGTRVNPNYMPYQATAQMTDTELRALWLYLQSLPPKPEGNR